MIRLAINHKFVYLQTRDLIKRQICAAVTTGSSIVLLTFMEELHGLLNQNCSINSLIFADFSYDVITLSFCNNISKM